MKICNSCLIKKDLSAFHKNHTHKDGYNTICKVCKMSKRDVFTEMLSNSKFRAKKKGLDFNIDSDYLVALAHKQNNKCALTGLTMNFKVGSVGKQRLCPPDRVSIDRIDSSKGYVIGNIQLVTDLANRIKIYYTMGELLDFCEKVIRNNK